MSTTQQLTYDVDFGDRRDRRADSFPPTEGGRIDERIPRVARLLALAIRMEGLIREQKIRDYAQAARLGGVTRARMTQIMQLLNLAPDIQVQILLLPAGAGLRERNLRAIVNRISWDEQRRLFQVLMRGLSNTLQKTI